MFGQSVSSSNALNPRGCLEHRQENRTSAIKCKDVCKIVSFSDKYKFVPSMTSSPGSFGHKSAVAGNWTECPCKGNCSVNNWSVCRLQGKLKKDQT